MIQIVRVLDALPAEFEGLRREAAGEGYAFLDRLADEVARGDYAGDGDLPVLLTAFDDGEFVGIGALTPDPYDAAPDLARVRHVYVSPTHRRGGVGRVLATALVQQGLAVCTRLSLRAADDRAAAFWSEAGFTRDHSGATRTHLLTR